MDNGSARRRTVNTAWRSSGQKPASNGHIVCGIGSTPANEPVRSAKDDRYQRDAAEIEAPGRIVKTTGDGMLAEFPSVVEKLGAARSAAIKPSIALMPIAPVRPAPRRISSSSA